MEATIKLREAISEDFRIVNHVVKDGILVEEKAPKIGQPYWLKSIFTNEVDNKNYQISEDTDWSEFKNYLRLKMVYVPMSIFELEDAANGTN